MNQPISRREAWKLAYGRILWLTWEAYERLSRLVVKLPNGELCGGRRWKHWELHLWLRAVAKGCPESLPKGIWRKALWF